MPDIFISYAREDLTLAKSLADKLSGFGWQVWWDRHIPVGSIFYKVIEENLDRAKCVIVLWTKSSTASEYVIDEATEAHTQRKLIPIQVGTVRPPMGLRAVQAILWNEVTEVAQERMLDLINHLKPFVGEPSQPPVQTYEYVTPPKQKPPEPKVNSKISPLNIEAIPTPIRKKEVALKPKEEESRHSKIINRLHAYNKSIGRDHIHLYPFIYKDKLRNATQICSIPEEEIVLGLIDLTVLGSATDCLVFTIEKVYYHKNGDGFACRYEGLPEVRFVKSGLIHTHGIAFGDKVLRILNLYDAKKLIEMIQNIKNDLTKNE